MPRQRIEVSFGVWRRLRVAGKRTRCADDCCDDCDCDEPGASPTADWSYEQTGSSPCTINLHDDSTPGSCGENVAWSWKVNGVEVSTDQNPTGIEVEDGDTIELTVTNEGGCSDSVSGLVECGFNCSNCPEAFLPATIDVTLAGYDRNGSGSGANDCSALNATHTLTRTTDCTWVLETIWPFPACSSSGTVGFTLTVTITTTYIRLLIGFVDPPGIPGSYAEIYQVSRSSSDACLGDHTLPRTSTSGGFPYCCSQGGTPTALVEI